MTRPAEDLIWNDPEMCAQNKVRYAQAQSDLAACRLRGMKIRTALAGPPKAAAGRFPYPARTCADWTRFEAYEERMRP